MANRKKDFFGNLLCVLSILLISISACIPCLAQYRIHGFIKDKLTTLPVAKANIYINRTQSGTMSGTDGSFSLFVKQNEMELVVSCIGYETYTLHLSQTYGDSVLTILLDARTETLQGVTVKTIDRSTWLKYHAMFLKAFLGESDFATACTIENADALHYHYDSTIHTLTAEADKPLVIINKALGYKLQYQLEEFSYNTEPGAISFGGYPLFTALAGNMRQQAKWQRNREEAYTGSLLQFMRSVFRNQVLDQGFVPMKTMKLPILNSDKPARKKRRKSDNPDAVLYKTNGEKADSFEVLIDVPVPADSFAYAEDSITAAISFPNTLVVRYRQISKDADSAIANNKIRYSRQMTSYLRMRNSYEAVFVESNGLFFPLHRLIIEGYWAWSERMGRLLPYDYIAGR